MYVFMFFAFLLNITEIYYLPTTDSFHILSYLSDSSFLRFNIYLLVGC